MKTLSHCTEHAYMSTLRAALKISKIMSQWTVWLQSTVFLRSDRTLSVTETDAECHREQRNSIVHQTTADKAAQRWDLKKRNCTRQDLWKRRHTQRSHNQNNSLRVKTKAQKTFTHRDLHIIEQRTYSKLIHDDDDVDVDVDVDIDHREALKFTKQRISE